MKSDLLFLNSKLCDVLYTMHMQDKNIASMLKKTNYLQYLRLVLTSA